MRTAAAFSPLDPALQEEQAYWQSCMEGLASIAFLPADREAAAEERASCCYETVLSPALTRKILLAAKEQDRLVFAILLSGIYLLLRKTGKGDDRMVGVPIGRQEEHARFINYLLLLRDRAGDDTDFRGLISQTKTTLAEANRFQNYPYTNILSAHHLSPVIDTIALLDTLHDEDYLDGISWNQLFCFSKNKETLSLQIRYNGNRMRQDTIARLARLYLAGLEAAFNEAARPVSQLSWLQDEERTAILGLNDQPGKTFPGATILDLLSVHASAEDTAITSAGRHASFREVHDQADRLARYLRSKGVAANTPVAILAVPSAAFIIALLGIMKAGGCYIPIDPQLPLQRKSYILADSGAALLLTDDLNTTTAAELATTAAVNIVYIDEAICSDIPVDTLQLPGCTAEQGAYILYTSGSTGRPKGVRISHANLHNYISWAVDTYVADRKPVVPLFTSVSFDLTVTSIFLPLVCGGRLIIYPAHESAMMQIAAANEATLVKLTPSHLRLLRETGSWPDQLKTLIVGGELFDRQLASDIHSLSGGRAGIYNEYGPTETTVGCAIYRYDPAEPKGKTVLIGKPAPNCQLYVLDDQLQPAPFGLEGEIYIGGKQVAEGYLPSVPDAGTSFVENPFEPGARLYKTGDSCILYEDGNMECTGRRNNQVKLNGYRIEPGEIEAQLNSFPGMIASLVLLQQTAAGTSCLSAFYIAEDPVAEETLAAHLAVFLPAYMIPLFFTRMDSFPLTINGKVDTAALPAPGGDTRVQQSPVNEKEMVLTEILSILLGSPVSTTDNFFRKGGDSIKIVQLAARLLKAGYKISVKDIYNHPAVSDMARLMEPSIIAASQDMTEGPAALNPVQQWFFENYTRLNHYNQSLLLFSKQELDIAALEKTLAALLAHHDALRMEVRYDRDNPYLYNTATIDPAALRYMDLRAEKDPRTSMQRHIAAIQSSIDIQKPVLLRPALFRLADGDRLLLVIHHLVTDGISWRILLEDLNEAYAMAVNGETIALPPKTASFAEWNNSLAPLIAAGGLDPDHAFWSALDCAGIQQIPADHPIEAPLLKDKASQTFVINEELTRQLVPLVQDAYQAGVDDFLLAGFALAAREIFDRSRLAIAMEGHGRENIPDNLDISRTIGWFTSIYPVIADIGTDTDAGRIIQKINNDRAAIPNKGATYGMLKYAVPYSVAPVYRMQLRISLNYLGSFDEDVKSNWFSLAEESSGESVDGNNPMLYDLEIRGIKLNGQIQVNLFYNRHVFDEGTIIRLKDAFARITEAIIRNGDTAEHGMTPGRFFHRGLTLPQIAMLTADHDPEDIYPLSPMQLGLYFHVLANPQSYYYNTFFSYHISGPLQADVLRRSFDFLLQRYPVLRANFIAQADAAPVLLVARKKEIPFQYIDLRHEKEADRLLAGHRQQLLKQPYDFVNDTLMRVAVVQTAEAEYEVIWCYHHILIDGWCLNMLWKDLLAVYARLVSKQAAVLPPVPSYTGYLRWLEGKNFNLSKDFWKTYLQGYRAPSSWIPRLPVIADAGRQDLTVTCSAEKQVVEGLTRLARQENCTIYTVLQCAWALLLSRTSGNNDIVFGQVVSGRPNIPGISEMVGLFINTLPKRICISDGLTLNSLIRQVWEDEIACLDHQFCPLREIRRSAAQDGELFDHVIVFENQYQLMDIGREINELDLDIAVADSYDPNEYDLSVFIFLRGNQLSFDLRYNACRYATEKIEAVAENLRSVLEWMVAPQPGSLGDMFAALLQAELRLPDMIAL